MFISCNNNIVFDDYKTRLKIKHGIRTAVLSLSYSVIADTISKNQLVIKVRHTIDYEFQNLFLFIKAEKTDTLELLLANKEGNVVG